MATSARRSKRPSRRRRRGQRPARRRPSARGGAGGGNGGSGGGGGGGGSGGGNGGGNGGGGRLVWLPVEDDDAWVVARLEKSGAAYTATRVHAPPPGVPGTTTMSAEDAASVLPVSGDPDEAFDDLTHLESISTGAVLHNLRLRHAQKRIYTSVGPILLAINPFAPTSETSAAHLAALAATADPDALPPHVFNLARSAYTVMSRTGGPQSILVSGESGAGKTETAKLTMRCLAMLSSSPELATTLALESGLLLEAFGNAKTVHNHNSSRFGKWVEVRFSPANGTISGCRVRPYLLELSRVAPSEGERNYHIFYQMLAGRCRDDAEGGGGGGGGGAPLVSRHAEAERAFGGGGGGGAFDAAALHYTRACTAVEGATAAPSGVRRSRDRRLGFGDDVPPLVSVLAAIAALGQISFMTDPGAADDAVHVRPPPPTMPRRSSAWASMG